MKSKHELLGRTYELAGVLVRVAAIDGRGVTFVSAEHNTRLINASVTHDEFRRLDLKEV